jgi:transposase
MARAALIVRKLIDSVVNAVVLSATNAAATNTRIQRIKAIACG